MNSAESKLYRALLFATLLIGAVVFFWGLGDIALMSYNEARRAIPIGTMYATGDWLLPRLNGELYLTKPPLLYWLGTASAHLFGGPNEWAVRLPAALAATAIVVAAYRYARRQFGAWPALFTAQLLLANTSFTMFARRTEIEMLLTALCFSALLSALRFTRDNGERKWLWLSYFLLGAAVLAKGPLALLFVTLPLLIDALYHRQPRQWQALRDPIGWGIFVVVGASWYAAVTWQMGFDIWQATIQKDILNKVHGTTGEPVFSYFLWLLTDFFPASVLLIAAPLATWRCWKNQHDSMALLLAVLTPLLIFTAFSDKHAKYLLPVYPLIAILLGKRLGELYETAGPAIRRSLLVAGILLPVGYAAFYAVAESRVFEYRYSAFPKFTHWISTVKGVPIYGYHDLDERLVYYARRDIPLLDIASLQSLRVANPPLLLLVEHARIAEVQPQADCAVQTFKPYLKKNKSLAVFGFGAACDLVEGR
jgi:4-amino-4-deoxy-L-arabinose transferase-like glycosyltransferase